MNYVIAVVAVLVAVILDQYTKGLAITHLKGKESISVVDGVFRLEYLENKGAAWGMLQNQWIFLLLITIIVLTLIAILYVRLPKSKQYIPLRICMIFITAGAIGNMIDRIRYKYVVDFLYFELIDFPIFNVADVFVSVSACVLVALTLFYYKDKDFDLIFASLRLKRCKKQEKHDEHDI